MHAIALESADAVEFKRIAMAQQREQEAHYKATGTETSSTSITSRNRGTKVHIYQSTCAHASTQKTTQPTTAIATN